MSSIAETGSSALATGSRMPSAVGSSHPIGDRIPEPAALAQSERNIIASIRNATTALQRLENDIEAISRDTPNTDELSSVTLDAPPPNPHSRALSTPESEDNENLLHIRVTGTQATHHFEYGFKNWTLYGNVTSSYTTITNVIKDTPTNLGQLVGAITDLMRRFFNNEADD